MTCGNCRLAVGRVRPTGGLEACASMSGRELSLRRRVKSGRRRFAVGRLWFGLGWRRRFWNWTGPFWFSHLTRAIRARRGRRRRAGRRQRGKFAHPRMFLHFDRHRRHRMSLPIFLHTNADDDHEHGEGDDAFFFRGKNEEVHRRRLAEIASPPRFTCTDWKW